MNVQLFLANSKNPWIWNFLKNLPFRWRICKNTSSPPGYRTMGASAMVVSLLVVGSSPSNHDLVFQAGLLFWCQWPQKIRNTGKGALVVLPWPSYVSNEVNKMSVFAFMKRQLTWTGLVRLILMKPISHFRMSGPLFLSAKSLGMIMTSPSFGSLSSRTSMYRSSGSMCDSWMHQRVR